MATVLRFASKLKGDRQSCCGRVSFQGEESFLELADEALTFIKKADSTLYNNLTSGRHYCFIHQSEAPASIWSVGVYGVSKHYVRWAIDGMVAMIIFSYYYSEETDRKFLRALGSKAYEAARDKTANWLKNANVRHEIIDVFRDRTNRPIKYWTP